MLEKIPIQTQNSIIKSFPTNTKEKPQQSHKYLGLDAKI